MNRALRWSVVLIGGALLYFLPIPGLTGEQRRLLAVFIATILALVTRPAPMGVSVLIAMTLLAVTGTVPANRVLLGFSNQTVWLIFSAYLFARAIGSTGLGMRVAYLLIRRFATTPLRLGYAVVSAGMLVAPFVPSDTARGGGVIFPITRSLAHAFASEPGATAGKIGSFLMIVCFHGNYLASAVFLTSMAANPLIADFVMKIANVEITWLGWLAGSCVPALFSLAAVPYLIHRWHRPEIQNTEPARALAADRLREIGPMSARERGLVVILFAVMFGWVTSPWHGISNAFVALTGISAQLLTGLLQWDDLLGETKAWDVLLWFAPLIMMADELNSGGAVKVVSEALFQNLHGLPWGAGLGVLVLVYFYIHYVFASMTAHTTALYPAFFTAALATGAPPMLAALPLAYFSNLNAGITHYGTGSAPVFFGAGYVNEREWWRIGFLVSLVNVAIWLGIGGAWWKLIGLW
ncbi:MAG: DASS family sodium-coupled anion symporter [Bryobacteraceae bacterium]